MRTTRYSSRVTIQAPTQVENEIGGWSDSYADVFTSWASVVPTRGVKRMEYAKLEYVESYEVEIRERTTQEVTADCRILYRGNPYQIISIMTEGARVKIDIGRDGR
jgi:SPP1 family predicted phage head-tail adaptor